MNDLSSTSVGVSIKKNSYTILYTHIGRFRRSVVEYNQKQKKRAKPFRQSGSVCPLSHNGSSKKGRAAKNTSEGKRLTMLL